MKLQHFTAVTSVLQILFVLRVVFRVYVYWLGSDTYPVFRTRFSPTPSVIRDPLTLSTVTFFIWSMIGELLVQG